MRGFPDHLYFPILIILFVHDTCLLFSVNFNSIEQKYLDGKVPAMISQKTSQSNVVEVDVIWKKRDLDFFNK